MVGSPHPGHPRKKEICLNPDRQTAASPPINFKTKQKPPPHKIDSDPKVITVRKKCPKHRTFLDLKIFSGQKREGSI